MLNKILSVHWVLIATIWFVGAGVLHDFFVLQAHQGEYDRALLHLLMDGHVLILSGAVTFVCYLMMLSKIQCGPTIAILVALFMLIYCAMIFPFLPSALTIVLSIIVIVVSVKEYKTYPSIWEVMKPYRNDK
jgi:hypothetical protein